MVKGQRSVNLLCQDQSVNIFGFGSHIVCVATTQLRPWIRKPLQRHVHRWGLCSNKTLFAQTSILQALAGRRLVRGVNKKGADAGLREETWA